MSDKRTLTLTKVPAWVVQWLEARAALHGNSMNATAKAFLAEAIARENQCAQLSPTHCAHTGLPNHPQNQTSVHSSVPHTEHTLDTHQNGWPSFPPIGEKERDTPEGCVAHGGEPPPGGVGPTGYKKKKKLSVARKLGRLKYWDETGKVDLGVDARAWVTKSERAVRRNSSPLSEQECARVHGLFERFKAEAETGPAEPPKPADPTPSPDPAPEANTASESAPQRPTVTEEELAEARARAWANLSRDRVSEERAEALAEAERRKRAAIAALKAAEEAAEAQEVTP